MKRDLNPLALIAITVFVAGASQPARAEFKCDRTNLSMADATACAKAAESTTALRQYVQRTQSLHGLYVWDYVRRDETPTAQVATRVADRGKPVAAGQAVKQ